MLVTLRNSHKKHHCITRGGVNLDDVILVNIDTNLLGGGKLTNDCAFGLF